MSFQVNFGLAIFVVASFGVLVNYLDLLSRIQSVKKRSEETVRILRDSTKNDREKQEALQYQSRKLFKLLGVFVGGNFIAIVFPLAVVWGLGQIDIGSLSGTLAVLSRLDFLLGVAVLGSLVYLILWRLKKL